MIYGKVKGFVRDNADPENRGRLRVFCPQVMGATDSTKNWLDWAEPCFPWMGGLSTGDFGPPLTKTQQVADFGSEWYGVWIEFQGGRPDFPVWVGTFTIAKTPTSDSALTMGVTGGAGQVGGGIIGTPASGDTAALNPPQPTAGREVRLRAPKGVDIVIGSDAGGYLVIGASGVHAVGPAVTLNGASVMASAVKVSI